MKILLAHDFYKQPGGEDRCFASEVALLEANGHEVIQHCIHNDALDRLGRLQMASRTVWSLPAYGELRALIRARRPQIAHFHNTFPLLSPAVYYAARDEGVPVVQTLHNFRLLCPNALFFRAGRVCEDCLGKAIPWPGVIHKCYRDSSGASAAVAAMLATHRALGTWRQAVTVYVALTNFSRRKFIAGGLPPGKVVVKPNFVSPDPRAGAGTGGYALFVGRLSAEKGLDTLLGAWKILRDSVPLKIVGSGPLASAVAEAAARNGCIEVLGSKTPEEVQALIGAAMFLVLPSACYENFPRVAVEAYAAGTPVLASRLGAMGEVVRDGHTGLHFEPGNANDLSAKVRRLLADPTQWERLRQAAREEYEQRYTAEANYLALRAIYERALANGSRERPAARALRVFDATGDHAANLAVSGRGLP